jgi:RNA polymerase sigma-70 factor (ECF subfamily)
MEGGIACVTEPEGGAAAATDEVAWMRDLANGDRDEALSRLYGRYAGPVFGLGLRLLGDRGSAEELVQDTFLRLWRSAPAFDPGKGSTRTFVYTLARRALIDLRRRASSRRASLFGDESVAVELEGADVHRDRFEDLVLGLEIRTALNELSHKHREVLTMHFDNGLTQQEIADRLQLPLGTVKTRTYHGLRALRAKLEGRGVV